MWRGPLVSQPSMGSGMKIVSIREETEHITRNITHICLALEALQEPEVLSASRPELPRPGTYAYNGISQLPLNHPSTHPLAKQPTTNHPPTRNYVRRANMTSPCCCRVVIVVADVFYCG